MVFLRGRAISRMMRAHSRGRGRHFYSAEYSRNVSRLVPSFCCLLVVSKTIVLKMLRFYYTTALLLLLLGTINRTLRCLWCCGVHLGFLSRSSRRLHVCVCVCAERYARVVVFRLSSSSSNEDDEILCFTLLTFSRNLWHRPPLKPRSRTSL